MKYADRAGNITENENGQDRLVESLYGKRFLLPLKRLLISRPVSFLSGVLCDTAVSKAAIRPFIDSNHIDMSEYADRSYKSFNDFFAREIKEGRRPFSEVPGDLCSPCDGKISAYPIGYGDKFTVKGRKYTLESLLRNKKLARDLKGGMLVMIRLSVDDYHRYSYIDDGIKSFNYPISGKFNTVNPNADKRVNVYAENSREYTFIRTENFGTMIQMEVGAMMVGKIVNLHQAASVKRGMEKGYFRFGGSTVILIFQRDKVKIDDDIISNTEKGIETIVKMGEKIGEKYNIT